MKRLNLKRVGAVLCFAVVLTGVFLFGSSRAVDASSGPSVVYSSHVQTYGWLDWKSNGALSGTTGESKRLEAICIQLKNTPVTGNIRYRAHVQSEGWQEEKSGGQIAGTVGKGKRLEAIQISLEGKIAETYDIYYRAYVQSYGWLDWAKNGETAGTEGIYKRLEAVEIRLQEKGKAAPGNTETSYISAEGRVIYRTHVQKTGWQTEKSNGELAGTTGEAKRLEAIQIKLNNLPVTGGVAYRTHIQTHGWQDWVNSGSVSGTTGEAKRLEAIQIKLTGAAAYQYDIYYRVHAQSYGWLGWAKNGESAGTEGLYKRLEAIEIRLVKKGEKAPESATKAFLKVRDDAGLPFFISTLVAAKTTTQLVMAVGNGTKTGAVLYYFERNDDLVWEKKLETYAYWGENGISYHTVEGDRTTPAGSFSLGMAFGNRPNPGTSVSWVDVNQYLYWIDDVNSPYYNQLIDSRVTPDGWSSGEHLIDIQPDYDYAINIEVNPQCAKDSTSAIFLHCTGGSTYTAGCVAVPENVMVSLLKQLRPGAKMIIAEDASKVNLY